ncbi:MAG: hypothetical protein KAY81_05135, partial [Acinetobacter sp.]|nr:hypothetical protein [Acinetobacter sp.]
LNFGFQTICIDQKMTYERSLLCILNDLSKNIKHIKMEQLNPSDLKAIFHSKRANVYYLEYCRVMQLRKSAK